MIVYEDDNQRLNSKFMQSFDYCGKMKSQERQACFIVIGGQTNDYTGVGFDEELRRSESVEGHYDSGSRKGSSLCHWSVRLGQEHVFTLLESAGGNEQRKDCHQRT
ncbi:hypothetical protein EMIT07CA2_40443 [Brevibacillus sp. IT-7CA2]